MEIDLLDDQQERITERPLFRKVMFGDLINEFTTGPLVEKA